MSRLISLQPVTFTITIRPKLDGTADVQTRCDPPEFGDLIALSQAMLGVMTKFLQQIQSHNQMLVGRQAAEGEDDGA